MVWTLKLSAAGVTSMIGTKQPDQRDIVLEDFALENCYLSRGKVPYQMMGSNQSCHKLRQCVAIGPTGPPFDISVVYGT